MASFREHLRYMLSFFTTRNKRDPHLIHEFGALVTCHLQALGPTEDGFVSSLFLRACHHNRLDLLATLWPSLSPAFIKGQLTAVDEKLRYYLPVRHPVAIAVANRSLELLSWLIEKGFFYPDSFASLCPLLSKSEQPEEEEWKWTALLSDAGIIIGVNDAKELTRFEHERVVWLLKKQKARLAHVFRALTSTANNRAVALPKVLEYVVREYLGAAEIHQICIPALEPLLLTRTSACRGPVGDGEWGNLLIGPLGDDTISRAETPLHVICSPVLEKSKASLEFFERARELCFVDLSDWCIGSCCKRQSSCRRIRELHNGGLQLGWWGLGRAALWFGCGTATQCRDVGKDVWSPLCWNWSLEIPLCHTHSFIAQYIRENLNTPTNTDAPGSSDSSDGVLDEPLFGSPNNSNGGTKEQRVSLKRAFPHRRTRKFNFNTQTSAPHQLSRSRQKRAFARRQ